MLDGTQRQLLKVAAAVDRVAATAPKLASYIITTCRLK